MYSQETMQTAFTANEALRTLHREMITVADAEEAEKEKEIYDQCAFESFTDH